MDDKLEAKFRLLEYEHKVMELRRAICFKAFLSCIALDLLLLKGFCEYQDNFDQSAKYLLIFLFCVIMILFLCFVLQIEKKNFFNRQKYTALEENIWCVIQFDSDKSKTITEENRWQRAKNSWAGTWTFLTVFFFTVGCCLALLLQARSMTK